ncbi:MAG: V-type ATP synthase subunit A, partial [Methanomassiliicoccales archaeon]|nr:V-type ATP synthase subunit A [Methanomassiliicoccales archaeon]
MDKVGEVFRVAGPVVTAVGISPRMYDVALVGDEKLMGEVIKIYGDKTVIQVYEDTSGLRPGERVEDTGEPLLAELGPGLLGSVYDGVQRPLPVLVAAMGDFIKRGVSAPGLDRKKKWNFCPVVRKGDSVVQGQVIGKVQEGYIEHRIMLPHSAAGTVDQIKEGEFTIEDTICSVGGKEVQMLQRWPVRS